MRIEVWADVVCPWCWIGETRLYRALGQRPDVEAQVVWRAFQLQPDLPREGKPWDEVIRTKFGGPERAKAMFQQVAAAGAHDDLRFDFNAIPSHPNTRDAHRLVLLAQQSGIGRQMAEALFAANFTEGRDIGKTGVLADVAAQVGMDRDRVARFLGGDELGREVDESQAEAASLGISGVPYFVIDGKYAFSGAQSLETFVSVLDRVREMEAAGD
ncbi:MAG TPA: DsbA family oxidoreductase [Longimicrobium sp.]|jgi:predicted DsbA family dithiol-disulfide isomerase|uniref:DsbA family oxidoreductase n=1 Tax=Longimicrobium sp. TaxID=2029185 RepID=UPI002ED78293